MKETEVKILEVNRQQLEQTLKTLGAKKVFDGPIQTLFFDFTDGKISKTKSLLRLRKAQDKVELTYKSVSSVKEAKTAEEYSVEVSSLDAARKILENIGLTVTESMEKHRTSYKLDDARFDFDRYMGEYSFIPEFLEIEAQSIRQIRKYASSLGFKPQDCLTWSTDELVEHYKKSR